jgi:tetratricopeptide (TPR) repeat protein
MARIRVLGRSVVFVMICLARVAWGASMGAWDANFQKGCEAMRQGHYAEARVILEAAYAESRAFEGREIRRAQVDEVLGTEYQLEGQPAKAEALYFEAREILEASGEAGKRLLALTLDSLGEMRFDQGRWDEAEECLKRANRLYAELGAANSLAASNVLRHVGELYSLRGQLEEAEKFLASAVAGCRKAGAEAETALASALHSLGRLYVVQAKYAGAEPLLKEALALNRALGENHPAYADGLTHLASLYRLENRPERAEPLLRKAAKIYETANDFHLANALTEMGLASMSESKYGNARESFEKAAAILEKAYGPDSIAVAFVKTPLAEALLADGDYEKAAQAIGEALRVERKVFGEMHYQVARSLLISAQIEEKQRRPKEADADYRKAIDVYSRTVGAKHPDVKYAESEYARFAKKWRGR